MKLRAKALWVFHNGNNWSPKERRGNKRLTMLCRLQVRGSCTDTGEKRASHLSAVHQRCFPAGGVPNPFQLVPSPVGSDDARFRFPVPLPTSFFLLPLYYRCRFFPGIRGANIPPWQATVLQAEQISTFPQLAFWRSECTISQKRRNEREPIDLDTLHVHQLITWEMQMEVATDQRLPCGSCTLPLPCVYR